MAVQHLGRGLELFVIVAAAMLVCVATIAASSPPATQADSPSPDPKLRPQDVVRIVIEALGKNDANDTGIKTTWKFASPANQQATGPLERFIPMVKNAAYAPMLNHRSAKFSDTEVHEDQAIQLVILTATDGTKTAYVFQLSRQSKGPLKDCWMTDGVFPVRPNGPGNPPGADDVNTLPV